MLGVGRGSRAPPRVTIARYRLAGGVTIRERRLEWHEGSGFVYEGVGMVSYQIRRVATRTLAAFAFLVEHGEAPAVKHSRLRVPAPVC